MCVNEGSKIKVPDSSFLSTASTILMFISNTLECYRKHMLGTETVNYRSHCTVKVECRANERKMRERLGCISQLLTDAAYCLRGYPEMIAELTHVPEKINC